MYEIFVYTRAHGEEVIDTADTVEDRNFLLAEYRMAYASSSMEVKARKARG